MSLKALILIIFLPLSKDQAAQPALNPALISSLANQSGMELMVASIGGKAPKWVKPAQPYSRENQAVVNAFVKDAAAQAIFKKPIVLEKINILTEEPAIRQPTAIFVVGGTAEYRNMVPLKMILNRAKADGALVSFVDP